MRPIGAVAAACEMLVVRVGLRAVAVPIAQVGETLRPLPIETLSSMPPFVKGVATIRGIATPVVDVGALLGEPRRAVGRFVTVRLGQRQVALAVESVLGVWTLDPGGLPDLPQLLQQTPSGAMDSLDAQLLLLLRATSVIPEDVWQLLVPRGTR